MKERKQKTLAKRLLVAMLSVMMTVTFIPTSLLAFAAEPEATPDDVQNDIQTEVVQEDAQDVQNDTQTEAVQEDAQDVQTDATEPATEATEPAVSEPKQKTEKSEPKKASTKHFTKELDEIFVDVEVKDGAFNEDVSLKVDSIAEGSKEYEKAEKALAKSKQVYSGMLAFDIHFENGEGKEVEPNGTVSVKMTAKKEGLKGIVVKDFNADSVQVSHIVGKKAEVVADTNDKNKIDGTVEVEKTKKAVKSIDAEFKVDSFSAFVLTWGDPKKSATIHWGTMGTDGFEEFKSTTTVDSTASSVDLAVNVDGYYYVGATYNAPGTADALTMTSSTIKKDANDVWTAEVDAVPDDDIVTEQTVQLEDKSDIYVIYAPKGGGGYNPPGPPPATLDNIKPETKKTVKSNGDGTYNIRLDVTGHATEDTKQGANVIVMLDMTYSMRQNDMNGTRIAAAKSALLTMIDALDPGYDAEHPDKNLVNFTLATFGNTMTTNTELSWTQSRNAMETAVRGLSNSPGAMGTNWQGGLGGAESIAEAANRDSELKKNPTYVIFVTDGAPNCWRGHTSSSTGNDLDPAALPYAQTAANSLTQDAILYGVFCGPAGGFNNLADMVTNAHGAGTINGASQTDLEAAFSQIAGHIVAGMAAGNVTVDDGIPSLSNVSANVTAGEAGGFTYYIKPAGGEEKEWVEHALGENDPGAPGATYDKTNGVTWDLGEAGTLQEGWVYSIEFTVWPSQKAYDTIADLNNGVITMTQPELDAAGIGKNDDGTYYLLTNTHLNTTFEDPTGHTYDVIQQQVVSEAMALPTETISVQKIWNNFLDQDTLNPPPGMKLILDRDGEKYLYGDKAIEVSSTTGWKKENIFISVGQIKTTNNGYEILETGHDYEIVEPEQYTGDYRWELKSEVYHPMVIDGVATMLILDDDATGTGVYELTGADGKKHKYKTSSGEGNTLQAWNDRRSWLQIEKTAVTGEGAPTDALFEFTVTINDKNGEDIWYSAYGPDGIIKNLQTNGTAETNDSGNTGYYYKASGSAITVKLQKGWTLRFLNLPKGTTYTVEETGFPDGFAFNSAADRQVVDTAVEQETPARPTISNTGKAEGTINVPNVEFYLDYTNKYAETSIKVKKVWDDADDQDGKRSDVDFDFVLLQTVGDVVTEVGRINVSDLEELIATWENLPVYKNGVAVIYSVMEDLLTPDIGYTTDTSEAKDVLNGSTTEIKNSYTPEKTKLKVEKVWQDNAGEAMEWPDDVESVTVYLTVNKTTDQNKSVTLTADKTSDTFTNLDKYAAGEEIEYGVAEVEVSGYTVVMGDPEEIEGGYQIIITNTPNKGNLKITKTISGLPEGEAPEDLTFTVTGPDDYSQTIAYTDFENGEYTIEDLLPGEYTVSESGTDYPDYTLAAGTETEKTATVERDETATAAFTNTYTRDKGSLKITKTISGLPEGEAPEDLTFTVTGPDDYSQTIAYTDFENGEYTIENIPTGEYTVSESGTDYPGYGLDTENSTMSANATVKKGETATAALKNTYIHVNVEIEKTIDELVAFGEGDDEVINNVTFTFRVVGKAGNQTRLNTIVAVEFNKETGKTTQKAGIEKIPADITSITVTEIDSGNYNAVPKQLVLNEPTTFADGVKTFKFAFNNTHENEDFESGAINKYEKSANGYVKAGTQPASEGGAGDGGQE